MEAWLPFHDVYNMYPQNTTVNLKFLFMIIYANYGVIAVIVIASTTYVTAVELFDECFAPSSHKIMIITDENTNIYTE